MTELVVVSLEPWDEVWRRNQHLVAGLLDRDPQLRCLFVEPAADPSYALRRRRRPRRGQGLRTAGPFGPRLQLLQPTKWLPRLADPHADQRLARQVMRVTRRLSWSRPWLWINDPSAAALLVETGWPSMYDITDDWLLADRQPRELQRLAADEAVLLRDCAQVVVCSDALLRSKSGDRAAVGAPPPVLIRNAVDLAGYRRPLVRPTDLPDGRVALYVGTVHPDRMDLDLLARTAQAASAAGITTVVVGPAPLTQAERTALEAAGIRLLGSRPAPAIPDYLRSATVLLVPHRITAFTESLDPIKSYEYRAARRPVVSTAVPGFTDDPPWVHVVQGNAFPDAVIAAAGPATTASDPGPSFDGLPDWSDRVSAMAEVLNTLS